MGNFKSFQMHKEFYDKMANDDAHKRATNAAVEKLNTAKRANIEDAILKFVIKERLALAKMDSEHFNALIDGEYQNYGTHTLNQFSIELMNRFFFLFSLPW